MDTKKRTLVKTIGFKIATTATTYFITGSLASAIKIHIAMTIIYLIYERIWSRIKWGHVSYTTKPDKTSEHIYKTYPEWRS